MNKYIILLLIGFMVGASGCASIKQGAARVAGATSHLACDAPAEARYLARIKYYEASGKDRLLVGFCKGDDVIGFNDAVDKYITEPKQRQGAVTKYLETGDFTDLLRSRLAAELEFGRLKTDEEGCIEMPGGRFCPDLE